MAALSQLVAKEQHANTLDNLCGALGRMITTNCSLVPLKNVTDFLSTQNREHDFNSSITFQVLPVFVQYLPLREDFTENLAVFRALDLLYRQGDENLIPLLGRVVIVGLQVLYKKEHHSDGKRPPLLQSVLVLNFYVIVFWCCPQNAEIWCSI